LFVDPTKELAKELVNVDLTQLSPVAAFDLLRQWKEKYGK
jgi:hypothetical protein